MNPYNILGVSENAEDEVIHAAYHALVKNTTKTSFDSKLSTTPMSAFAAFRNDYAC